MQPESILPATTAQARLGSRQLFPKLKPWAYLNHAAISPPSTAVQTAMMHALQHMGALGLDGFWGMLAQRQRLRERLGLLIGAAAEDIGLVPNTTTGLITVAQCFPWETGDQILVFTGEFPANVTPWQQAALRYDLKVSFVSLAPLALPGGADLAPLEAALKQGVRLVALSAVQFQTGLRVPLEAISALCHRYGAALCVDGVQACGLVPLDVGTVDFLAVGGHKWLMGLEGAGFLYINPEWTPKLRPVLAGWLSHEEPVDFLFGPDLLRYNKPVRKTADFMEGGAPNAIGYAGLEASVDLILQLGRAQVFAHVQTYLDALEQGLLKRGFQSLRMPDMHRRSGILSVVPPGGLSAATMAQALSKRGVSTSTPDGFLRFAPHWPNAHSEVPKVLDTVDEALCDPIQAIPHG